MRSYFRKSDQVLDEVSFRYLGGLYQGRGILRWDPAKGFDLDALVERSGPPVPSPVKFFELRLATGQDWTSLRLKIRHGGRAYAFVALTDRFDVMTQDRLHCRLGRVCFMDSLRGLKRGEHWSGSALLKTEPSVVWPDLITRRTQIDDETIHESSERRGLRLELPQLRVVGLQAEDDDHLELHWSLHDPAFSRPDSWRWPLAFRDALSMELGCSVALLEREVHAFPRLHRERSRAPEIVSLGTLLKPFEGDIVDKTRLFDLAQFLFGDSYEAKGCRKLFDQMIRAAQQRRWTDSELILSTALEGILRYLDRVPSSNRAWDLTSALARFQDKYLSSDWRIARKRAAAAFEQLRHPTAHPDWIVDMSGRRSEAPRSQSFGNRIFLSRFFGYMILALAGRKDLKPMFGGRLMTRA